MAKLHKFLTIDTVLGPAVNKDARDPLMLTLLTGQEGISMPFLYEVTVARSFGPGDDFDETGPKLLIGTMARVGILKSRDPDLYTYRSGMFATFQRASFFNPGGLQSKLAVYKGTLVPAFQMLGRETVFRIFEAKNVVTIINDVLKDMQARFPDFLFDTNALKEQDFPNMEYCVQFGESTFSFLTRLMERFGIFYTFDSSPGDEPPDAPSPPDPNTIGGNVVMRASNVRMVFGKVPATPSRGRVCEISPLTLTDDDPNDRTIAEFQRRHIPVLRKLWFGNINPYQPTHPFTAKETVHSEFDLLNTNQSVGSFFQSEEFPARFQEDPAPSSAADLSPSEYSTARLRQDEAEAHVVSGKTQNPTFLAGRGFSIKATENSAGEPGDYIIQSMTIKAFENSYMTTTETDLLNFFFRDFFFSPFQSGKKTRDFLLSGFVSAGLANYFQNEQALMFQHWTNPASFRDANPPSAPFFLPMFAGGATEAGICAAIPLLLADIDKVLDQNDGGYANSFVALKRTFRTGFVLAPLPGPAAKPVAAGPQLAVVVGPKGAADRQEIFTDAIGRVRVRFPWDPGPPSQGGNSPLPPPWSSDPQHQYDDDRNTCWVRVSEGWAGQGFGTQFLPRVGQEVIVSFLNGDPERPIITGRVYNSTSGHTNLPFPSKDKSIATKSVNKLADLRDTAGNKVPRSGIKTRTMPLAKGAKERFHLLRFDDDPHHEQYLIRSQGRLDLTAFASRFETIHADRHMKVGSKQTNPTPAIAGDYIAHISRHYHLHVGDPAFPTDSGNRITLIEQNDEIEVKKDSNQAIGGDWSTSVGGQATLIANGALGKIVIEAMNNITINVGGSSIVITPASIAINSPMVLINTPGPPPVPAIFPKVDRPKDPSDADPGESNE